MREQDQWLLTSQGTGIRLGVQAEMVVVPVVSRHQDHRGSRAGQLRVARLCHRAATLSRHMQCNRTSISRIPELLLSEVLFQ